MSRARAFAIDVGGVLASWVVLLLLEDLVVGTAWRGQFTGPYEMLTARTYLSPLALAVGAPAAIALVAVGRLVAARRARELAAVALAGGAALAYGVSFGRHFASWAVRAPFVAVVALAAAAAAWVVARRLPLERPRLLAAAGAAVAAGAWLADGLVLPRLYPAFHAALLVVTIAAWSATWLAVRGLRAAPKIALGGAVLTALSIAWAPRAGKGVAHADNMRRVLVEHAPILGRAVVLASRIEPPPPMDEGPTDTVTTSAVLPPGPARRSLDWAGRDILLVTIDTLRADHLSSYGYRRRTTPNIDGLATRGARFEHAYCATPHTSYSVTSMMTGKYMRPLLAMNAGEDSETWAGYLRKYGYRTAAFYPPAIFFIDTYRFQWMRDYGLGFEYRKEEFAKPDVRRAQIEAYLDQASKDKPLFLWVHLFEPHEPYEMHDEHPFSGDEQFDAYDSEIAAADAFVGEVLAMVEARRPGAVVLFSADHGEEFGEHGGRYHGTTTYEEQVRVPLIVVGPGVVPGVVSMPVQTIDLLPTTLAALDIPLPPRLRGRDLGPWLARRVPEDEGLAFAEADDYTMVARGTDRLVCARKIAACTLYDVAHDPDQQHPVAGRPARVQELRRLTAAIERDNGKLEAAELPPALRRALQGDREAAEDVAQLFDDARVEIRRAAARVAFRLRAPEIAPHLRRALDQDEDEEVRRWCALALVRIGQGRKEIEIALLDDLLRGSETRYHDAAALALAEQGDARGEAKLVARWERAYVPNPYEPGDMDDARDILNAFVKIRSRAAVPALLRTLEGDVRLRPFVAEALGGIGDPRAKEPLAEVLAEERFANFRAKEARALLALGARDELRGPLTRFAGIPAPMPEALPIMREAGLLRPDRGGVSFDPPRPSARVTLRAPGSGPARLLVLTEGAGELTATVGGKAAVTSRKGKLHVAEIEVGAAATVELAHPAGIAAAWIVRRAADVPPPPPGDWGADGPDDDDDGGADAGVSDGGGAEGGPGR